VTQLQSDALDELRLAGQVRGDRMQDYHLRRAEALAQLAVAEQLKAANAIAYSTQIMTKWGGIADADIGGLTSQIGPLIVAALDLRVEPRD
jgi:hypothetical protein